jgi:hypothetical protein
VEVEEQLLTVEGAQFVFDALQDGPTQARRMAVEFKCDTEHVLEAIDMVHSATTPKGVTRAMRSLVVALCEELEASGVPDSEVSQFVDATWDVPEDPSVMRYWSLPKPEPTPAPNPTPTPETKKKCALQRVTGVLKLADFVPRFAESNELQIAFILTGFSDLYNYYAHVMVINNCAASVTLTIPKSKFKKTEGKPIPGYYAATIDTRQKTYQGHAYYSWTYRFGGIASRADAGFDDMLKIYVEDVLIQFNHGNAHTFSHFWRGTDEIDLKRFYQLAKRFGFRITDYKPSFQDGRNVLDWNYADDEV